MERNVIVVHRQRHYVKSAVYVSPRSYRWVSSGSRGCLLGLTSSLQAVYTSTALSITYGKLYFRKCSSQPGPVSRIPPQVAARVSRFPTQGGTPMRASRSLPI